MPMSPLRQRLRERERFLTTFSILRSVEAVEIAGLAGFDGIILDLEHGPYGVETLVPLILAARGRGIYAIVRVLKNEPSAIGAVLDAGADGVLVPQVSTPEEARAVVAAARFAPDGARGANSWVRAADYSGTPGWFGTANAGVAVMVMIEGRAGVENAEAIMDTPSLDGVFLGPVDLSHALGVPGEVDHPTVIEKMRQVIAEAEARSLCTSVFAPTPDGARQWFEQGVKMVACGVDTGHLFQALKGVTSAIRGQGRPVS